MPTPHNKLLENRAREAYEAKKKERAMQWSAVTKLAPEIANFITEMYNTFGKPKFVKVERNGEVILKGGEQDCYEKLWDGKLRPRAPKKS